MSGALDNAMRSVASAVVGALGTTGSLKRTTKGAYDPETGVAAADVVVYYPIAVSPPSEFTLTEVAATAGNDSAARIDRGDIKVLVPAKDLDVTPDPKTDVLVFGSMMYRVIAVSQIWSGALVAAHVVQCRR